MWRLGNWLTVVDGGEAPVLVEPVKAAITLRREAGAPRLTAWALDPTGKRLKEILAQGEPGGISLTIGGDAPSIYYELAP
jgi:hypothetical protein